MEKFKEKINQLKLEIDGSNARADVAEKKLSALSQQLAAKDSEVNSHLSKIALLEDQIQESEQKFQNAKQKVAEGEVLRGQTESLHRKVQMLENTYSKISAQVRDAEDKVKGLESKTQEFQARAAQAEQEKENFEVLNEEIAAKYNTVKRELEDTLKSLEEICRMLWTRTEYDKLQQMLEKEGDNVDFEKIAEKYFPNKDPLELAYDAEFPPNEFEPEPAFNRSVKRPSGRYHLQYTKVIDDAIIREFKNEFTLRGKTLKEKEEWARSIDPLLNWSRARNRYQVIKKIMGNGTRFTDLELRRISGLEQEGCSDTEISVALGYSSAQQFKEKMVFHMSNNPLTVENSRRAALLVQRQGAIIGPEHVDLGLLARVTLPLVKKYIDETPADLAQVKRTAVPMDADIGTKYWSYRLNAKLLDMIHVYKDKEINWKEVSVSMGFPVRKCKDVYKKLSDDESWLLKRRGFFSDEDDIELLKAWKAHKANYNSYKTLMKHDSDSYRLSTRLQRIFRNGLVKKKPKYIQAIAQSGVSKDDIVSFLGSLNAPSWKQLYRDVLDSDN